MVLIIFKMVLIIVHTGDKIMHLLNNLADFSLVDLSVLSSFMIPGEIQYNF
jgi:hypothetical protein